MFRYGISERPVTEQDNDNMEHRCSTRNLVVLNAVLDCRSFGLVPAKVRDVGLGGMFVETGLITLRPNTPVEVAVSVQSNGVNKRHHFRALVVWTERCGAGLMFRSFDDAAYGALHKLVLQRPTIRPTKGSVRVQNTTLRQALRQR